MEKGSTVTIKSPLYIEKGIKKTKRYHLNLNQYRNWHYIISNQLKAEYKNIINKQLTGLSFKRIRLDFIYYKPSKRKVDRSNVLCIHEKFFCDALVEAGCLTDDNDEFLESTHYYDGGIDKDNPRVDIIITEVDDN